MAGSYPEGIRYTDTDEWVRCEDDEAVCGITAYASEQLGDVVYLQLPEVGHKVGKRDVAGEIESVKAVSDLYAPLAGDIIAVNTDLDQNPGLVNEDPYGRGWIMRIRLDDPSSYDALLTAEAYGASTAERR